MGSVKKSKFPELRPNHEVELRQLRGDLEAQRQIAERYRTSLAVAERHLMHCTQAAEAQDAEIRRLLRAVGQLGGK